MALQVISTRFFTAENSAKHRTDRFELQRTGKAAIFRRGSPFLLEISFNRTFDQNKDTVKIYVTQASTSASNKTNVSLTVKKKELSVANKIWHAQFIQFTKATTTVQVKIPSNAPVAEFRITVQTARKSLMKMYQSKGTSFRIDTPVYVLFNPWCSDDGVYMDNAGQLEEYVLNDTGKVWRGTHKNPEGCQWLFGQFKPVILPSIMILLDRSSITDEDRADPVKMARCISAVTNSNDENGLIVGNWNGNYDHGTNPVAWAGSPPIFEEFYKTQKSVKYGQCWVFSGVIVTICRALGIPCRSVTNYGSAHDCDASLTIDKYIDETSDALHSHPGRSDSIWNFHVWNDVWMTRPDLAAKEYGGWQCIDGTPQETSDSKFMCGPAPVEAIRRGKVNVNFDSRFVFTEVRADICFFQKSSNGSWSRVNILPDQAGKRIVTKRVELKLLPGIEDLEDITDVYKNPYGSPEDKLAMKKAIKVVPNAKKIYRLKETQIEDVKFQLTDIKQITFGEGFDITIEIHNKSSGLRSISVVFSTTSILYTGVKINRLKRSQVDVTLGSGQRKTIRGSVKPSEYMEKLSTHSLIKITAVANVKETDQMWTQDDDFVVQKPSLNLALFTAEPQENKPFGVTFSFNNPLSVTLTKCTFSVDGPAVHKIIQFRDVEPKEKDVRHTLVFTAEKHGSHAVTVIFNSKQLTDIKNTISVPVRSNELRFGFNSHRDTQCAMRI